MSQKQKNLFDTRYKNMRIDAEESELSIRSEPYERFYIDESEENISEKAGHQTKNRLFRPDPSISEQSVGRVQLESS